MKYTDPTGMYDVIDDTAEGVKLTFNFLSSTDVKDGKKLSEFLNENPEFWGAVCSVGLLGYTAYTVYDKNEKVNSFVNNTISKASEINNFLLSKGFDATKRSYIHQQESGFMLKLDFSNMRISFSSATIAVDGMVLMPFNENTFVTARLNCSVDVNFQDRTGTRMINFKRKEDNSPSPNYFNIYVGYIYKF